MIQVTGKMCPIERRNLRFQLDGLDKDHLDDAVMANLDRPNGCYSRALADQPSMFGKVTIKFIMSKKDGSVSKASIKDTTIADGACTECLTTSFLSLSFDGVRERGIVIAEYPVRFCAGR